MSRERELRFLMERDRASGDGVSNEQSRAIARQMPGRFYHHVLATARELGIEMGDVWWLQFCRICGKHVNVGDSMVCQGPPERPVLSP